MSTATGRRGVTSLVVALVGLGISAYLTIEHYDTSVTLACPGTATINCVKVTTSRWSEVAGVPVAVLGLVFFVAMVALCNPVAWQRRVLDRARLAGAGLGVLVALYLVWIELFRVDAICLWCTGVHVCTVALLGAVLWSGNAQPAGDR
ncbi:MAG TPA: vitamin K epoxide reductase family protein [Jatrophihabitantaceae bacterium]|jgi:uncharacterized membrane protein|nr:vitamin K epoxide reductase family protein [Jatrophihabitantaceae bacterium]